MFKDVTIEQLNALARHLTDKQREQFSQKVFAWAKRENEKEKALLMVRKGGK